tara:strand:+ start:627 stop:1052 length:426 start_codon:yes stop_codon:yes gene_type:complete
MATHLIGSDGSVTMPDGYRAAINTFSCTLSRTSQITTAFGDTSQRRRLSKVLDITGSVGGTSIRDETNASPLGIAGHNISGDGDDAVGLILKWGGNTDCTLGFDAVINSVAFAVTQDGESAVTFNFEMSDANGPDMAWDES